MIRPRIVFFGTPELARICLATLADSGNFEIAAVVTQPDKPKGRDLRLTAPPVKTEAQRRNLTVLQPARARDPGFIDELRRLQLDLIAVAAYGQLLPPAILDLPPHGCLNVHTSLLPRYRGAAPIQWALLDGLAETGVTIMRMDAGLDTGAILTQRATAISPQDDAASLHDRLAVLGAGLLVETIPGWIAGTVTARPQPAEGVSHARKITKEDGRIDWSRPAVNIWNQVRALTPWPGAFTHLERSGTRLCLKVWKCDCLAADGTAPGKIIVDASRELIVAGGVGSVRLLEVQREGGRRMSAKEFLAGHPLSKEDRFISGVSP